MNTFLFSTDFAFSPKLSKKCPFRNHCGLLYFLLLKDFGFCGPPHVMVSRQVSTFLVEKKLPVFPLFESESRKQLMVVLQWGILLKRVMTFWVKSFFWLNFCISSMVFEENFWKKNQPVQFSRFFFRCKLFISYFEKKKNISVPWRESEIRWKYKIHMIKQ